MRILSRLRFNNPVERGPLLAARHAFGVKYYLVDHKEK